MPSCDRQQLLAALATGQLLREVAGHPVARRHLAQLWGLDCAALRLADLAAEPAAGVEAAAGRRIGRRRHVAAQDHPLSLRFDLRIGDWHRAHERAGVRVERTLVELL